MDNDEYVPSEDDVRSVWVVHERDCGWEPHPGDPSAEFDRFLARVRRDAKAEGRDEGQHDLYLYYQSEGLAGSEGRNPYRETGDQR